MKTFRYTKFPYKILKCFSKQEYDFRKAEYLRHGWKLLYEDTYKPSYNSLLIYRGKFDIRIKNEEGETRVGT